MKKTVLITGATGNIGGGAALSLARRGAQIVLMGRKQSKLDARAEAIRAALAEEGIAFSDDDIQTLVIDFTDPKSVRVAAAEALNRYELIDTLTLCVGKLIQDGPRILPDGHEFMFATSVLGPFLFTRLLSDRLEQSNGLVLQVIAPFDEELDWDDLESVRNHKTTVAYNRVKTCERVIAGELARRYAGRISSVAFNPWFIIDKKDPELKDRWPKGPFGWLWTAFTLVLAKPPRTAGEPIADLVFRPDRGSLNGALYKLRRRVTKPDRAMNDKALGKRLWDELSRLTKDAPEN